MSPRDGGSRGPRGTAQTQGKNSHPASGPQVISIETAVRKSATAAAPDVKLISPPGEPMPVARQFVKERYTQTEDFVLRDHLGNWYRYNGACWPEVDARIIQAELYRWLEPCAYKKKNKDGDVTIEPWAPTRHKVANVIEALRAVTLIEGVTPPMWTNGEGGFPPAAETVSMTNGLLHVPTRAMFDHTPQFFVHHSLPFAFDPEARDLSQWLAFLHKLWPDDESSIQALQELFGYVLGGGTDQQKLFLLVGPKRAGKGTIARVLKALLGEHNVAAPTMASLGTNFGLSPLIGKPLAIIGDARLGSRTDAHIVVERLLSISGEDPMTIDRKYKDPWTGQLPTRFMILTNELPKLSDASGTLASRFIPLVFFESFYGREDRALTRKLLTEAPAIFNWSLQGLDRLNQRGHFVPPEAGSAAIQQLEDLSSPISAFLRDCCEKGPDKKVRVERLWDTWKEWCHDQNQSIGTKAVFGRNLIAAVPTVRKVRPRAGEDRRYVYEGIARKNFQQNTAEDPGPPGPPGPVQDPAPSRSGQRSGEKPLGHKAGPSGPSKTSKSSSENDHRCVTCGLAPVGRPGITCIGCSEGP